MAEEDKSLNEFISYVGSLYEIVPPGRVTGFDVDFQKLKQLSVELKQCPDHVSNAGQIPENKKKNRYKDITPFDFSRVTLTCTNDEINSDYINASFIKGADGHRNYIASQGPLPHTVLDFWQMLWQYNINVIVMVCREIELGKKKCERYWADRGDSKRFGDITVTLSKKEDLKDGYCLRTIKAEKGNEIRYIKQFHYTSWPDHGVPKTCLEILSLINHVRDVQSYSEDETTPLCVHCSAGCGRTGAVLAVDYVRNLLECKKVPSGLRTFEIISEMRKQRPAIVQTKDQYEFVNMAISEMFRIYMQIRTVAYKEFNAGYQQEDYVNINISTSNAANKKKIDNRPTTLSYENIDVVRKQQQEREQKLYSPAENDIPPAKPSRPALGRPISQIVANNNTPKSTYSNFNDRKQSAPVVSFPVFPADKKEPPPAVSPKPRSNQNLLSSLDARSSSHPRLLSGSPVAGKDVVKSTPPTKPKAAMKPESAAKKVAVTSPPPKPPGANAAMSPLNSKPIEEMKKRAPIKPQRSMRKNIPHAKNYVKDDHLSNNKQQTLPANFQKYQKKNIYNDVILAGDNNNETTQFIDDVGYGEIADVSVQRSNSNTSVDSRSSPRHARTPPRLPARTAESQIALSESPPALPTRTADSYVTIEDEEQQTYEAVEQSALTPANHRGSQPDTGRRPSANATSGTNILAAKAKGFMEKTSNAFSKVGATIGKGKEDDNGSPPSTMSNRKPSYVPTPMIHGGQDISFGKRLKKKVKGARNLK